MILYFHFLSENPIYAICSFQAYTLLGDELFGRMSVYPNAYCETHHVYLISDEYL